jgi:tetratricopeptide (TPR) repeat protein
MKKLPSLFVILALLMVLPARGEAIDSLQILMQQGDSCMQQFNTFEALNHYQQAYSIAKTRSQQRAVEQLELPLDKLEGLPQERQDEIIERLKRDAEQSAVVSCPIQMKLADCYYKRANYRQASDLLKLIPEDSLSHEAFRELANSYKRLGDTDSYVYWTSQLVKHYPMDGEMVAGLILGYAQLNQPEKGLTLGLNYSLKDRTNILVNRAVADAFFLKRDFTAAGIWYDQLLQQGDSTFNTLYSAGMSHSQAGNLEKAYNCLSQALILSQLQHAGCAYRLGVVCVDTKRYEEGLRALDLAIELTKPDTTMMKAITLSQGEGYYLTEHYPEAVEAWKRHLSYNPGSIATYYNIANTYTYLVKDDEQAKKYYQQFLDLARQEAEPNEQLKEMIRKSEEMMKTYRLIEQRKQKTKTRSSHGLQ